MQYESCADHLLPCTLPLGRMSGTGTKYLLEKKREKERKKERTACIESEDVQKDIT